MARGDGTSRATGAKLEQFTATPAVRIGESALDLEERLAGDFDMRRLRRRYAGIKHGADCDCGNCSEAVDGQDVGIELVAVEGVTVELVDDQGVHYVVPDELRHRFHPAATRIDGGAIVLEWNMPHHGEGATDCGEVLERVGGVHPSTKNLSWWVRLKLCGQRDCQRCGPAIEAGIIIKPGTWEIRSARRAAEAIAGHLEDHRRGIKKWRELACKACKTRRPRKADECPSCGGHDFQQIRRAEMRDYAVHLQRRGHHAPPRLAHIVYSVPAWMWDDLPPAQRTMNRLASLYRRAYRHLKEVGVRGGYLVTHGTRIPSQWNHRRHVDEGLHFHVLGITTQYVTGRVDGEAVSEIWRKTSKPCPLHELADTECDACRQGIVIKRVTKHHKGTDIEALNDTTTEGPDPNRSAFGSLLYLLSHATWPTLAVMREPDETFDHARRQVTLLRQYPALVKTSTQTKAIRPFGEWVYEPETTVILPAEEDTCPITGHAFAEDDVWPVLFDRPPPDDTPAGIVLRGRYRANHELRVFEVGDARATPPTGEQARIMARLQGRPAPDVAPPPPTRDPESEARERGRQLAEEMKRRHEEDRGWEL